MVEAVYAGVVSVNNVQVNLIPIVGKDIIEDCWKNDETMRILYSSDAIIFGPPAYMESVSGQMKSFLDATTILGLG